MRKIFKHCKTTLCGLAGIFAGVKLIVIGNISEGVTAIATGIGLVFAQDIDFNSK